MTTPINLIAWSGSIRAESVNTQLLDRALALVGSHDGVTVDRVNLADFEMPLYNQDLQEASDELPEVVTQLGDRITAADAVLIASPEYNGGYSPLFKNVIDWVTRINMFLFANKYMGVLVTTPGSMGGVRGGAQMAQLFENMFLPVHQPPFSLGKFYEAIAEESIEGLDDWVAAYVAGARANAEKVAAEAAAKAEGEEASS